MRLHTVISCLFVASVVHSVPIRDPTAGDYDYQLSDSCNLPKYLGFTSSASFLEDCKGLSRANIPVPFVSYGNIPKVCCPKYVSPNALCFPTDFGCLTYEEFVPEDDYGYYADYEAPRDPGFDKPVVSELGSTCGQQTCVPLSRCQNIVFPNTTTFCGMENNNMQVCCPPEDVLQEEPVVTFKPRFPNKQGKARDCSDKVDVCKKWKQNGVCDLDKHFKTSDEEDDPEFSSYTMFNFMLLTCQQTCGWCGDKGCVDEHTQCEKWTRGGFCITDPLFMSYACRESCGLCGFLSPENTEDQVVNGKSYTDVSKQNFECGRYKSLDVLREEGLNVFQDEFPDREEVKEDGTCEAVDDKKSDDDTAQANKNEAKATAGANDFQIRGVGDDSDNSANDEDDDENDTSLGNTAGNLSGNITCGQILIADRWMLTAAHCYDSFAFKDTIRLSTIRTYLPDHEELVVQKKVFNHPFYESPTLYNDIALVELGHRVTFDYDFLGDTPTCMIKNQDVTGNIASITGYGETEEGNDAGQRLGTVNTTLVDSQSCHDELVEYVKTKKKKKSLFCNNMPYGIQADQLCGRGAPKCTDGKKVYSGACKGDSGGPVETTIDGRRTLVGLVSGSINCNSEYPEWFTSIGYFREWIECIMREAKGNKQSQIDVQNKCIGYATNKKRNAKLEFCKSVNH